MTTPKLPELNLILFMIVLTLLLVVLAQGAEIRRTGALKGVGERLKLLRRSYMGDNLAHLFRLFREVPGAREGPGLQPEQRDKTKSERE